jgi:hypothetical protein
MSSPTVLDDDHVYPLSPRDKRRRAMLVLFGAFVLAVIVLLVVDSTRPSPRWSDLSKRCPTLPAALALGPDDAPETPIPGNQVFESRDPDRYSCIWLLGSGVGSGLGLQADVARYGSGLFSDSDEIARKAVKDEYITDFRPVGPQATQTRFGDVGNHRWELMTAVDNVTITVVFTLSDVHLPWSASQGRAVEQAAADAIVKALGE